MSDKEKTYLEELFEDYNISEEDKVDFDWGNPVGHEII